MRTVLAFALVFVAGCLGPGGNGSTPTVSEGGPTSTISVEAALPAWKVGQGWTYAVEIPGQVTRTFKMVVAEERETLWVVASSDEDLAIHQAVYSTNPVLGRISKTTLSPYQSGEPVEMFPFPLSDGQQWTATFFDEPTTFTARYAGDIDVSYVDARHGLGQFVEGFRITAQGESGRRTHYDFVEAAGWFTSFEVLAPDGAREIRLTLRDLEASYRGPFFFYRGSDLSVRAETHGDTEPPELVTHFGESPEGLSDRFALGVRYVGSAGTTPPLLNITLKDPAGTPVLHHEFSTTTQVSLLQNFPGATGNWTADLRLLGAVEAEVRLVGAQAFSVGSL